MTFAYPLLNEPLRFEENSVRILVIESQPELRRFISVIQQQLRGLSGEFVLADGDNILDMAQNLLFISEVFSPDLNSKKFQSKIFRDACLVGAEFSEEFYELISNINSLAVKIGSALEYDAVCEPFDNLEDLVKLMGFHIDEGVLGFSERLLEYMELNRKFFGKRLFVFYNLKALMSPEEMVLFYRDALYRKFDLLLLEDCQRYSVEEYERVIIVDKDLCVF